MPRVCFFTGKKTSFGRQKTHRGKAKYLGGVGTKITGITRRQFKPNLQRVHVTVGGTNRAILACTKCIRSGAVTKKIHRAPFKLPMTNAKKALWSLGHSSFVCHSDFELRHLLP